MANEFAATAAVANNEGQGNVIMCCAVNEQFPIGVPEFIQELYYLLDQNQQPETFCWLEDGRFQVLNDAEFFGEVLGSTNQWTKEKFDRQMAAYGFTVESNIYYHPKFNQSDAASLSQIEVQSLDNESRIPEKVPTFINKLFISLERNQFPGVIAWQDDGLSFEASSSDRLLFTEQLGPSVCRTFSKTMKSYGFGVTAIGDERYSFRHKNFIRNFPKKLVGVVNVRSAKRKKISNSVKDDKPLKKKVKRVDENRLIVWSPAVVIMHIRREKDENKGHSGMSLLIFDESKEGYCEAVRLHDYFQEQKADRDGWDRSSRSGGHFQLFGYMARKRRHGDI